MFKEQSRGQSPTVEGWGSGGETRPDLGGDLQEAPDKGIRPEGLCKINENGQGLSLNK